MGVRGAVLATAAGGAVFTVAVLALPVIPVAVRDPELHIAVEMTAAWVSLIAAVLVAGRLRRRGRLPDLVLFLSFGLTGLVNAGLSVVPAIVGGAVADAVATWGALTGRTLAAAAFALAAFVPDRRLPPRQWQRVAGVGCVLLVAVIAAVTVSMGEGLPAGVGGAAAEDPAASGIVRLDVHPLLPAAQATMALAYGAAAWGFTRRARRDRDPLLPWVAAAVVLAGFARIHYAAVPSLYADVVYSGDVLRVGFYCLLLGGVLAELAATWRELGTAAAAEERRRIARDLHDGLAQELAFIASQATWLARRLPEEQRTALLASASQRALDESRRAIDTLAGTTTSSLPDAVTRAIEEVASRYQQRVELEVDSLDVPAPLVEQLVRIIREAVGNAARHGEPGLVSVRVRHADALVVEIEDDGVGFDPDAAQRLSMRFGLRSMRERAEALGGSFSVSSAVGAGTTVRVEVPWTS